MARFAQAPTPAVLVTNGNVPVTEPSEPLKATVPTHAYVPEPGHSLLTEPTPQPIAGSQPRAYGEIPAAILTTLAQRQQPATAAEIAKAIGDDSKPGVKRVWQALQRLCKSGKVRQHEKQYHLAS